MKIHLNLSVANLDASVRFYETLLQAVPLKHYDDYALFVTEDPGLELALDVDSDFVKDKDTHFGVVVTSTDSVKAAADRLQEAGFVAELQLNNTCCYARQSKVWTRDPDGRSWEIYVVHEETSVRKIPDPALECKSA
jgi:catechol 2,3-dioxygenase-like lactoylglutathione lyase family enzyme